MKKELPPENQEAKPDEQSRPRIGRWYWVKNKGGAEDARWLGCVVDVGSNYVALTGPSKTWANSMHTERIHFDIFWQECEEEVRWEAFIQDQISSFRDKSQRLIAEVQDLTARLSIGAGVIEEGGRGDVQALATLGRGTTPEQYKKSLVKARDKTLPELFKEIENTNDLMASWMKAAIIPMQAQLGGLKEVLDVIRDRIFSVELYAGLVEQVVEVKKGKPASMNTPLHLLQRRAYMDEECLLEYEVGGMSFRDVKAFDRWVARPGNFKRLLPFPRCMLGMRVRRKRQEHDESDSPLSFISFLNEHEMDKKTFLYIRNGEQLFRMATEVDFGEQLFPDIDRKVADNNKLWARVFATSVDEIITDGLYQEMMKERVARRRKYEEAPEDEKYKYRSHESDEYVAFTPETVYYDDIKRKLDIEVKKHNQIVLILQGLLDRSPVCHPHPPWQLWTPEGFAAAVVLVQDDARALHDGEAPDFEAYRERLNATLRKGSITVGQYEVWVGRETKRECSRMDRSRLVKDGWRPKRYKPDGNPGPGVVDVVVEVKGDRYRFEWLRERLSYTRRQRWSADETAGDRISCESSQLLNIDEYQVGDYKMFYRDPRTRADYLKWAPLLIVAEEVKKGRRVDPRVIEREAQKRDEEA